MPSSGRASTEAGLPPLIVICGATATGKSALALEMAERLPGAAIVNADSRQVYRGMDIGTAKASPEERSRVAHYGLDLADPNERFSVAQYRRHAVAALDEIAARSGVALLVGGTGLYLRAVARGMDLDQLGSDRQLRAELEQRLESEGLPGLVAELQRLAPNVAGTTDLANPRRVVRALERAHLHGDVLPPSPRGYPAPVTWLGLRAESDVHRRWIAARARDQFGRGFLEEAAELGRLYDRQAPAFSAVGYSEAFGVLDGTLSLEQALERTIMRTNQLARRQRTWFRAEPDVHWLDAAADQLPAALQKATELLSDG
jgi:tRNA dimethylallyltransferase